MMKTPFALLGTPLVALVLAACDTGDAPDAEVVPMAETESAAPAVVPAETAPAPGAALSVARTQEYGPYLADANGRALYLLKSETQGQSNCYDACAEEWPAFLAPQGMPTAADPAVQAGMISTIQRRDGSMQVTYNGHPLYYYSEDQGPGQVTGQDLTDQWGEWYLVTPQGEELEEQEGA